jgi:hypothetical protein
LLGYHREYDGSLGLDDQPGKRGTVPVTTTGTTHPDTLETIDGLDRLLLWGTVDRSTSGMAEVEVSDQGVYNLCRIVCDKVVIALTDLDRVGGGDPALGNSHGRLRFLLGTEAMIHVVVDVVEGFHES